MNHIYDTLFTKSRVLHHKFGYCSQGRKANPLGRCGLNTFVVKGFNSCRKVNNEKDYAFRYHVGKGDSSNSAHNFAVKYFYNIKNRPCHLEKILDKQSGEEIKLKTSINAIRWLTFQACAFKGHDESCNSKNQGNFLKMLKHLASWNPLVEEIIQDKVTKMPNTLHQKFQKNFYMFILGNCKVKFVRRLMMQNIVRERFLDFGPC